MTKAELSAKIEQEVKEYLEKGNKIQKVPTGISWNTQGNARRTKRCKGWCGLHKPLIEFHSAKGYTSIRCKKCRARDAIPGS